MGTWYSLTHFTHLAPLSHFWHQPICSLCLWAWFFFFFQKIKFLPPHRACFGGWHFVCTVVALPPCSYVNVTHLSESFQTSSLCKRLPDFPGWRKCLLLWDLLWLFWWPLCSAISSMRAGRCVLLPYLLQYPVLGLILRRHPWLPVDLTSIQVSFHKDQDCLSPREPLAFRMDQQLVV